MISAKNSAILALLGLAVACSLFLADAQSSGSSQSTIDGDLISTIQSVIGQVGCTLDQTQIQSTLNQINIPIYNEALQVLDLTRSLVAQCQKPVGGIQLLSVITNLSTVLTGFISSLGSTGTTSG